MDSFTNGEDNFYSSSNSTKTGGKEVIIITSTKDGGTSRDEVIVPYQARKPTYITSSVCQAQVSSLNGELQLTKNKVQTLEQKLAESHQDLEVCQATVCTVKDETSQIPYFYNKRYLTKNSETTVDKKGKWHIKIWLAGYGPMPLKLFPFGSEPPARFDIKINRKFTFSISGDEVEEFSGLAYGTTHMEQGRPVINIDKFTDSRHHELRFKDIPLPVIFEN